MRLGGAEWGGDCEHSVNLIFAACLSVGGMKRDKAAVINNKHDNEAHKCAACRRGRATASPQIHVEVFTLSGPDGLKKTVFCHEERKAELNGCGRRRREQEASTSS